MNGIRNDASRVKNRCGKRVDEMWVTRRFPSLHRATALISTAGVGYRRQLHPVSWLPRALISSEGHPRSNGDGPLTRITRHKRERG